MKKLKSCSFRAIYLSFSEYTNYFINLQYLS